jgi:phosphopantothenoylcysteine decarboxylase/phosphopantothenate--cysteine ligase
MTSRLKNKHMVLGVCGGIAAYKSVEVLRLLIKRDASVRVIMTANATEFVGWMTFEALSGKPVSTSLFEKGADASIKHIDWAEDADAVLIAPATANIIGKLANGIADDALTTFMMAVTAPVFICPSMNTNMYRSRAVQRNLTTLADDGYVIIEPGSGELACGTTGPGRLPEPEDIVDRLESYLTPKDLKNKRVLVTAGPTRESVDPVRYISNPSTGKMGYAVARAAENRGAAVTLISGPSLQPKPLNVALVNVITAEEMAAAVLKHSDDSDIIIKTAAVSDFRPRAQANHKLKKEQAEMCIELEKTRDILKELGKRKKTGQILVGFAAETEALEKNAAKKLAQKNLDIIAGNLIGELGAGFGSDTNRVTLFSRGGTREVIPEMDKDALAHVLMDRIMQLVPTDKSDGSN